MDNLEVASYQSFKYDKSNTGECIEVSVGDSVCCFLTDSNKLVLCEYLDNIKTFLLDENISNSVVQLKYLSIWQVVFIATHNSLIIFNPKNEELTVIHTFTTKITRTSWNPNETFLIIANEKDLLFGFTLEVNSAKQEYCFIETNSASLDDPVPNSVYVGWGSHNTQFKGVKKKDEEKIEEIIQKCSPPQISWRGNGEQFVVNFWRENRRYLKVFNSNLKPQFQSEVYPNLLPLTSFKGQGNFIACAARHNEKNKIVIFEKNCLMKSEFFVPESKGEIKYLQYHPDMHLLAIYSQDLSFNGYLNIYLNCNAHWYLKQQLYYPSSKKLLSFHWSTILDKTMCTLNVLTSEAVEQILFRVVIHRYPENSLVAVIDGIKVHFSKFSDQIVPPPMSSLSLDFDKPVNKIFFNPSLNLYQFVTSDHAIHQYLYENGQFNLPSGIDLYKTNLDVHKDSSNVIYKTEMILNNIPFEFVLDRKQDLLVNNAVVCNNVLSMYIHENYLLFSHASCKLYCVRLKPEILLNDNWNLNKFYSREVEQGSKIVCVTCTSDIVLQLPRGNLETITCRVIAIDSIEKLLAQKKWEHAVYQIRQQRLNWNLLIDLNPQRFLEHIGEFIEAVKTVSLLNNIVSEFSKDNCLQTMYSQCFEGDSRTYSEYDKTQIFSSILDKIICLNPVLNLVSIVTLQTKHFTLKSALKSVCAVFQKEKFEICKKAMFQILLHKHAKDVINEAYTLYNIDFMTFIYTCCSEDPRIFEPELQKLIMLNPTELRFKMNVLGKNFKLATKYLIRCSSFDEKFISDFITKHATQCAAYECMGSAHPNFKLVSQLFSKYLSLRTRHNEAGLVLERAGFYKEALDEYKRALNWHQVLRLFERLQVEKDSRTELLLNLANELVHYKRVDEAVLIYEFYCGTYEKAIEVLTEKKMFQKALVLAGKYGLTDLIAQVITPAIIKYRTDLYDRITELGKKFVQYTSRLQLVREKKLYSLKYRHLDGDEEFDNDDLYSEYGSIISSRGSSIGSKGSRSSTLSSRNRRKQEKKKTDLREGGVYEDIALIRQLYLLAIDIFECGDEVKEVCMTLTDDQSFIYCTKLHETLISVQDSVRKNIPKIWSDSFLNAQESTEPEILAVIQNRCELDAEFRTPPPSQKLVDNWKLLIFSKT